MLKRWVTVSFVVVFCLCSILLSRTFLPSITPESSTRDSVKSFSLTVKEPSVLFGMVVDNYLVIEDKIKRNQNLGDILTAYNVPARLIHQISQISHKVFDVRKIAPDKKYTLICNSDSAKTAKYLVY